MREIEFRGKKLYNGEWVYGVPFEDFDGNMLIGNYGSKVKVIPDTISEFTGLEDKNGTRIYEGDIIRTKAFGKNIKTGVNCADYDIFQVTFKRSGFHLENNEREFSLSVTSTSYYEIIGNIFDNPELLKGGEVK